MSGVFHFRNVMVILGIVLSAIAIIYLATEFLERISQWGRVLSLVLATVMLVSLGRHFEGEGPRAEEPSGWSWLRVSTAFYLLGLLAALTAVVVFLTLDDLDPVVKALATLAAGIGLILVAARRLGGGTSDA